MSMGRGGGLTVGRSSVSNNRGTGIQYGGRSALSGPVIDDSVITGNDAGGISVSFALFTLTDSLVIGNSTTGSGGGIRVTAPATLDVAGTKIGANTAAGNGGGILSSGNVTLTGSSVVGNTAGGDGGGIYNSPEFANLGGGAVALVASTVTGNTATTGGGIFNETGATFTADPASSFCGNTPDDLPGCSP